MNNNPLFYKGLIICFGLLYALVAFISFWHCIAFCLVGNPIWISVMMSFAFEVGLAATLFSVLTTDNNNNYVAWILMTFLTGVQVIGNVYSVYKYMVETGTKFYTYINDSMLHWFVEDVPTNEIMSIIAIILGALLPIVALLMTAMVSKNLKLWLNKKKAQDPLPSEPIPNNKYSNIPESPSQEDEELENGEETIKGDYDREKSDEALNRILEDEELPSKEQDFAEAPEIPEESTASETQDLVKARDEFYNALDEFKEQEERAKRTEGLFKDHFNEIPEELGEEDYNLDFKEEDRSGDRPIQEVVVDSPVADVSILDIDNQPAKENASEALSPIPEEPHPLKGKVEGTEEVIDVKNTPVINDTSIIDPTPISDNIKKNIEVIQQRQGPFSLFKPGQ